MDQWDKRGGPVYDKDADFSALTADFPDRRTSAFRRKKLLRKSPEATLDLHGLNQDEAWNALTIFFNDAKTKGLEKILIIHGKGNHAGEGGYGQTGILKKMVRDFIERCPFAGESGFNNGREGGEGASWVLLKNNETSVPGR